MLLSHKSAKNIFPSIDGYGREIVFKAAQRFYKILVFKSKINDPFGCHLAIFYTYLAADLPWFVVLHIALESTFAFFSRRHLVLFCSIVARLNVITCLGTG